MDPVVASPDYVRAVLALIFIVGLLWLLNLVVRRYGDRLGLPLARSTPGKTKRLQIIDSTLLDARSRLVLVQHDDKEHLILLGQNNNLLIQTTPVLPDSAP